MALRLGKKKQETAETDWSEDALLEDVGPGAVETPADETEAVASEAPSGAAAAPRKALSRAVLAALALLILAGAAAAAYFVLLAPTPEEEAPPIVTHRPKTPQTAPDEPAAGAPATDAPAPEEARPTPVATPTAAPRPSVDPIKSANKFLPGALGFALPGSQPPILNNLEGSTPHTTPGRAVPTPITPPEGLAGTPGRAGSRTVAVVPVGGAPALTPALQAQLDALWQQGAAAKHRGDYAAARQAWEKILQLSPGHPGIQEALDKLPQ